MARTLLIGFRWRDTSFRLRRIALLLVSCLVVCLFGVCLPPLHSDYASAAPVQIDRYEVNIPFHYDPPLIPFIVIQVCINGQAPLPFLVDTGAATGLVVDTTAARGLHLRPNRLHGLVNGSIDLVGAAIDSVSLVGTGAGERLDCAQSSAYLLDLKLLEGAYVGPRIAGIIGAPLLAQFAVRFDFSRRIMTIFTSGASPALPASAAVVPLRERNDGYDILVSPQKGITVRVLVDTGALGSSLPMGIAAYLKPQATTTGRYRQLGFAVIGDRWRLASYQIGVLTERDVAVVSAPSSAFAVLGLDLLSRFRVTLDFPRRKMILERDFNTEPHAHIRGRTGIELENSGKSYRVRSLESRSPAGSAGLKSGADVVSIDGHAIDGLPQAVVEELLDGFAGTQARLNLRTGGPLKTITFVRGNEFDGPHGALAGMILQKADGGTLVVLRVAEGSASERAGMVARDEVVALNGTPSENLTAEEAWQQIHGRKVTLAVMRRGHPRPLQVTLIDPWYAAIH